MVVVRDERTVNPSFGKPGDARLGRSLAGQTGGSTKRWPGVGAPASAKRRRPDIVAKDAKTVSLLRCARASVTRGVSLRPLRRSGVAPFACAGWGLAGASAVAAEECEAVCDPVSFAKQPRAGICRQEDPAVCGLPCLWLFTRPPRPGFLGGTREGQRALRPTGPGVRVRGRAARTFRTTRQLSKALIFQVELVSFTCTHGGTPIARHRSAPSDKGGWVGATGVAFSRQGRLAKPQRIDS